MKLQELRTRGRQLRQSALFYGVFSTGVRVGANLLLLPLLATRLTPEELAVWWVLVALGAFANLADLGFGPAISRVYSYLWAGADDFDTEGLRAPSSHGQPNLTRLRELNATVRKLYLKLAAAATVGVGVAGTLSLLKPVRALAAPGEAWLAWAVYLAAIGYNLLAGHWQLACQGINRVRALQVAFLCSGLSYVGVAAILLLSGWGLRALAVAMVFKCVVVCEFCRRTYRAAVPDAPGAPARPQPGMLRRLWPSAWKFGITSIGAFFVSNSSVLVSSHLLDAATTASYGLTAQAGLLAMNFAGLWLSVKWPQLTILRTRGRLEEMSVLFARRLGAAVLTFTVLAAAIVLAGNHLLSLKGTANQLLPAPYLLLYLAYLGQQVIYVNFGSLVFTENIVPYYRLALATGLGVLVGSVLFTSAFGLWGLLLAPLLVESAGNCWVNVRRGFKGQALSLPQFFRAAVRGHA
jgi:O-antigen/teichoic acid export membrane protein